MKYNTQNAKIKSITENVGKGKGIFTGGYQIPAGTEVTME